MRWWEFLCWSMLLLSNILTDLFSMTCLQRSALKTRLFFFRNHRHLCSHCHLPKTFPVVSTNLKIAKNVSQTCCREVHSSASHPILARSTLRAIGSSWHLRACLGASGTSARLFIRFDCWSVYLWRASRHPGPNLGATPLTQCLSDDNIVI